MIHSTALFALLGPLVAGRCYPVMFPQEPDVPVWPAIRYSQVGGFTPESSCGSAEPDAESVTVQLDIVATTYDAAAALALQVRTAMQTFTPLATIDGPGLEGFDPELRVFRISQDWTIHGSSTS